MFFEELTYTMENYIFNKSNYGTIIFTISFIIMAIKDYRKSQWKDLLLDLILVSLVKYFIPILILAPGLMKLFLFSYGRGMSDTFIYSIVLVDIISLAGGILAYKKEKYKILLFLIFLSLLYQYISILF